jgi:hypothetical protein
MKQLHFPISLLRLAICALLIASASQNANASDKKPPNPSGAIFATSAADGGRLFIRRSPTLGSNVTISLWIDGKVAGTLVRNRTYDRYLTPGRHILTASPTNGGDWRGVLDVHRGETYSYTASYGDKLVLTPMKASR